MLCPRCLRSYRDLEAHWRMSGCGVLTPLVEVAPVQEAELPDHDPLHLFEKEFTRRVINDYNYIRFEKFIQPSVCDQWHSMAVGWMSELQQLAVARAERCQSVKESIDTFNAVYDRGMAILKKYQSMKQRDAYLLSVLKIPYLAPKPFTSNSPEEIKKAARLSLIDLSIRMLRHDKVARQFCWAKSKEWTSGELHMKPARVYTDLDSGSKVRSSRMTKKVEPNPPGSEAPRVLQLGYQLHNDDGTFVNPIGTKRGEHKYSVTTAAIVNLPVRMRLSFEYLMLLSLVNSKLLKEKGGLIWSIAGRDANGERAYDDALTDDFVRLEQGVPCMLPNDDDPLGDEIPVMLFGTFCLVSADWLASQAFGFTPESTSAEKCCGECEWVSFAAQRRKRDAAGASNIEPPHVPRSRTHEQLMSNAACLIQADLSKTALKTQMQISGMNKLRCALQYMPNADVVQDKPGDIMHLYGCGISRTEGAIKLKVLFGSPRLTKVADPWSALRENITKLNRGLTRGKKLPLMYPQRQGKKISEMHLDLNASETFLYVMHSVTLIEPILSDAGRKHPTWLSWLAHRAVVAKCLQHVITEDEVPVLKELIDTHATKFDAVTEYEDLERPKHHFQKHLVDALPRFGPFRIFWCMPFEAFIQLIKKILQMSNWKFVAEQAMHFWSMKSALVLARYSSYVSRLGEEISYSSELQEITPQLVATSRLLMMASTQPELAEAYALRCARSFTREPVKVSAGDWILVTTNDGVTHVGRTGEIMEFSVPGRTLLRMMLCEARQAAFEDETRGQVISVLRAAPVCDVYVAVEEVALHEVIPGAGAQDSPDVTFTYVY